MEVKPPQKLTDQKWLNLFNVQWQNNGQSGDWVFASRKEHPGTSDEPDAVIVVPIHVQDGFRRLVVVREFRVPINGYEYAFPAGLKLPSEAVIDCAKRELKEETGLQLTTLKRVSPRLHSSAGLSDESFVMVFTECIGDVSGEGREASEEMSVHFLDINQVTDLCVNYKIKQCGKLWPVLYLFSLRGTLEM